MMPFPVCLRLSSILKSTTSRSYINFCCEMFNVGAFRRVSFYPTPIFDKQKMSLPFLLTYRYMAGHSKWQNIKTVKAEKDKQKSMLCNKYIRLVTASIREKGPDPKNNNKLARILEDARKDNVPSSTLEAALKKASNKKLKFGTIEMLGPGGCVVILEYETDNLCEMRRVIKVICRKYSAGIFPGDGGRWRSTYEQKGIIKVTSQLNGETFDCEKMLDAAIEAGAEDVQKRDEDNNTSYEFLCVAEDINLVKKELEQKFAVEEAYVGYLPINTVSLGGGDKTAAMDFLNELGELPDVSRMYENIE